MPGTEVLTLISTVGFPSGLLLVIFVSVWKFINDKFWPNFVEYQKARFELDRSNNSALIMAMRESTAALKEVALAQQTLQTSINSHNIESLSALQAVGGQLTALTSVLARTMLESVEPEEIQSNDTDDRYNAGSRGRLDRADRSNPHDTN